MAHIRPASSHQRRRRALLVTQVFKSEEERVSDADLKKPIECEVCWRFSALLPVACQVLLSLPLQRPALLLPLRAPTRAGPPAFLRSSPSRRPSVPRPRLQLPRLLRPRRRRALLRPRRRRSSLQRRPALLLALSRLAFSLSPRPPRQQQFSRTSQWLRPLPRPARPLRLQPPQH